MENGWLGTVPTPPSEGGSASVSPVQMNPSASPGTRRFFDDANLSRSPLPNPTHRPPHKRFFARWVLPIALITLFLLIVGAWLGTKLWSNTTQTDNAVSAPKDIASNYGVINLPLRDLALSDSLQGNAHSQLLINGQVQVRNGLVLFPSDTPTMPQAGELYYSQSTNQPYYYDGKQFVSIKPTTEGVRAIGSLTGNVALGAGLRVVGGQLDTVLQAGINDITGTPDQVLVSSTNGQVVLALPQAIAPSSDPTFAGLHIASSIAAGSLALGTGTTTTGSLAFHNAATSSVLTLQSGATASDLVFTLPTTDGTSGQCLSTDGHGQLSFTSCASGAGSGVTQLNGLTGALTIANASTAGSVITINDASTSQKGIAQFDPTNFLASSGVITTVQNISPSSGPTFAGLTLTAPLAVASGGTGATTAANARTNLGAAASGINADITATTALNTVTPSGALTLGAPGQHFLLQGNTSSTLVATNGVFTTTLAFANPTADVTLSVPALSTGSYAFCTTSGNCAGAGGGVTTPGGTAGQLATFTGSQTLANSIIRDDGSTIAISGAAVIQGAGGVTVGVGSTTTGKVAFANATNTNIFTLQSGATASSFTLTLPTADGAAGQCLSTDGSGVLNFHDCLSGSGAGGGVSSLNSLVGALTIANATGTSSTITINDASTVQKGIAQFDATNFSVSSGTVTTIQDIATTSSPTFASLTLSSPLTVANGGTGATTASGARSNLGAAASGANSDITALAGLTTALSVAQGGTGATTASGARSSLGAAASGTNADITATTALNTITPTGALTIGAPSQHLTLQGNGSSILTSSNGTFTTTIGFTDPIANTTLNFPALSAGTYMVCTTNGNCAGVAGGVTTSGGTIGKLAKFTGSQVLGDSILSEIGSTFTIAGSEVIQGAGGLTIGVASSANGKVVFQNATNAHTLALQSGTTASDLTLTLPTADGSSGQCLSTNGSGVLSFQPCLTGAGANGGVSSLDTLVGALTIANSSSAGSTITLDNASTSQKGIAQFNATNFAASAGTINTIQDIALTSSPTFAGLNVTGNTGIVVGTSTTLGTLTLRDGNTGAHGVTLQVQQPLTSNQTLTIPDATGTLCLQNAASCGFAAASGSSSYIQNQISSPQSAASYWISGTGRADTSVLTPLLDTATATGLNIGTTNATGINLNQNTALSAGKNLTFAAGAGNFDQSASTGTFATGSGSVSLNGNTTIAANKSLIANGAVTFTNATNTTTAFQVQDASTTTVLDVDTTNGRVGIGTTSPNAKLAITDLGFSDTFNRADSSSLGSNWTKRTDAGSDFQIVSNQLKLTSSDNSSNALSAYTSQGISSADYSVQADIVFPSSSDDWLSVFGRGSTFGTNDSQGYYAFASIGNQKIALYKRVAGTFTQVGASAFVTITAGTTYTIKLAMQGNSLSLYWNGQLATSTTDSTFSSAGFAGVALGQPNLVNSIWDNFSITPFTPTMNINNNLVVTANGQLGVGTNSPSYAIDVQGGNSINATGSYLLNGVSINTAGTLSNIAYLTNTSQAFTGINTFSRNGSGSSDASLVVNGTPVNNATSSLIRIGNSIAGGNASANGGTYLGLNAPNTGAGSAADFVNFQKNGSSKFSITNAGITTSATSLLTPLLDTASAGTLSLGTTTATGINLNQSTTVATGKNLIIGTAALATNATTGFLYLDTSAGAPTGTPLANTGTVATEYDTTNNKLCVFNSAWKCTAALADYAEWMPAAGATAGDVVSITEQKNPVADPTAPFMLGRSTGPYEHAIAGVVSHYAEEANMANGYKQSADYHAIALAGRVPVKVTASNGPIAVGDYLTSSSLPGVAMKATQAGTIIGKALESYSSSDPQTVGEILVLVNVSYTNPDTQTGNRLQPAPAPFDTATASVLHVGRTNATSIALDQATIVHDAADSATAFQVQKADGMPLLTVDATHMKVVVTNLEVTGTLTVRGHFLAGGAVPIVAPGAAACQQPTVTITGNDILGRVTITTGQGCTISGALASVTFQTAYGAAPIVMLTPEGQSSAALLGYATTAPQQFTINTSIPPRERTTYTFTYLVGQAISP